MKDKNTLLSAAEPLSEWLSLGVLCFAFTVRPIDDGLKIRLKENLLKPNPCFLVEFVFGVELEPMVAFVTSLELQIFEEFLTFCC